MLIPPVTRAYTTACVVTTLAVVSLSKYMFNCSNIKTINLILIMEIIVPTSCSISVIDF